MLKAYIPDAVPLNCDDYYIKELPTGIDELIFNISIWDGVYRNIEEETLIEERDGDTVTQYRVKAIDGGDKTAQIKALLVLDDWTASVMVNYDISGTIADNVRAVAPAGWTVTDRSGMTGTAQASTIPGGTPLDLLQEFRTSFDGASYRFDQAEKTVTIWDLFNGPNLGTFMTRELNLHDVQYKGKSTQFITRLYAYGKEGLSIDSVNGGLPYVDNFTYSNRIVCGYWQDTRYEIASNLKDAAVARLAELAVPERSFNCSVADLAAIDPARYNYLSFELFSQVGLIDETRSDQKIMHRVVERWRYPNNPEKNNIILSNAPRRLQVQVIEALKGPINGNRLESGSIGSGKLGSDSVLESKIKNDAVTVNKIANGAVVTAKIRDGAVTTIKVLDEAVTLAKMWGDFQVFYSDLIATLAIYTDYAKVNKALECSVLYVRDNYIVMGDHTSSDIFRPATNTDHMYRLSLSSWGTSTTSGGDTYEYPVYSLSNYLTGEATVLARTDN
jgi:phage minor structural protein